VGVPMRLSYHGRSHYNVLVDPTVADVGEGLGLPGYEPGLADRMQVEEAQAASEASALEAQLMLSVADASDVDATQDALLQAALAASAAEARHAQLQDCGGDASGASWSGESSERAWDGSCGRTGADTDAASAPNQYKVQDVAKPLPSSLPGTAQFAPTTPKGGSAAVDTNATGVGADGALALSEEVRMLLAMGFSLPRAVQAHAQFGNDLDSMLEYLTRD